MKPIGVIDFETDPFLFDRIPMPFACELLTADGEIRRHWSPRCAKLLAADIAEIGEIDLYAHNGGRFDFHYLLPFVNEGSIKIIRGRIAEMMIGDARLIDSYLLVPVALAEYKKTVIDYAKFEENERDKHKAEILKYLHDDCVDLLELITGMHARLGKKLTIGSAAMAAIKKAGLRISRQNKQHDDRFRPYYYGGRVQCFESGIWKKCDFQYADINSAYPHAMLSPHPYGAKYRTGRKLPADSKLGPQFVTLEAVARGCLPVRDKVELLFPDDGEPRIYSVTGHEIAAGLETGALDIKRIIAVSTPAELQDYSDFVLPTFAKRQAAKKENNALDAMAYKLLLNSAYGKFATDCADYRDYEVCLNTTCPGDEWELEADIEGTGLTIWSRPSERNDFGYYDVAVAASITGSVRAKLWRAIAAANRPIYCDTDSLIYGGECSIEYGDKLGQWKNEGCIDSLAIAAKKIYAARVDGEWKTAAKGAQLSREAIFKVASGKTVNWKSKAPTFKLTGAFFVERDIGKSIETRRPAKRR